MPYLFICYKGDKTYFSSIKNTHEMKSAEILVVETGNRRATVQFALD